MSVGVSLILLSAVWQPTELTQGRSIAEVSHATGALQNVCHLSTARRKWLFFRSDYNSSGVIYRGRYVITAAHNVYSPAYAPLTGLRVACGLPAPKSSEHIEVPLSAVRVASGYSWTPRRWDRDFAVVRLPSAFSSENALKLSPLPNQNSELLHLAGFPASNDEADRLNGERMFYGTGQGRVEGAFLRYNIETHTGSSGGPVWANLGETPVLAGIHIGGDKVSNRARLADPQFVVEVERMIVDLEKADRGTAPR